MSKQKVQEQFGASAESYATSKVHAKGASLVRMVELVQPQPDWYGLDIATAAGHTALAFAPNIAHVVATDITPEMLPVAEKLARERRITNIELKPADAEELPFENQSFDLVTCRIAAHHFPDIGRFMDESVRVLRSGGVLAIVDNVVPGSRLRGKKGDLLRRNGDYINTFEKLRDPSHHRCLSLTEWEDAFANAGISLIHKELITKEMEFDPWADRMRVTAEDKTRLKVMLVKAPKGVAEVLTPQFSGDRITFCLTEAILIGKK